MIYDGLVLSKLRDTGMIDDDVLCSKIEDVLNKPSTLVSPPPTVKLVSNKNLTVCGVAATFKVMYTKNFEPNNENMGKIELNGTNRQCDYRIYVALKTLLMMGANRDEDIALACKDVFFSILRTQNKYIGVDSIFQTVLKPTGDYYTDEIKRAMVETMYMSKELAVYTILGILVDMPDRELVVKSITEKYPISNMETLEKYLDLWYKQAKESSFKAERGESHNHLALRYVASTI